MAHVAFCGITPILSVENLEASINYYVRVLGFSLDWQNPGIIAAVSRDACAIMLCQGDQGNPGSWVWIGVGDIDPLLEEYRMTGAIIRHGPTNYSWAYELQIEDLDGNVLRFGSEPKADQPVGAWLDKHGTRWTQEPDGGTWIRTG